jgi:hypothetical protein
VGKELKNVWTDSVEGESEVLFSHLLEELRQIVTSIRTAGLKSQDLKRGHLSVKHGTHPLDHKHRVCVHVSSFKFGQAMSKMNMFLNFPGFHFVRNIGAVF